MVRLRLTPRLRMTARLLAEVARGGGEFDRAATVRAEAGEAAIGTLADIGCGRGELAVALVRCGVARRAVCGDRRPGAVRAARELASRAGLAQRIEVRLGDGLSVLRPGEAEAIVVAGLGGQTVAAIVEGGWEVAAAARLLVLQPVRGAEELRAWAAGAGAEWLAEDLVEEGGRFYPALALRLPPAPPADRGRARAAAAASLAAAAGWPETAPREHLWTAGPLLWRDRHPLLPRALARRAERLLAIADDLARSRAPGSAAKAAALRAEGEALRVLAAAHGRPQGFAPHGTNGGGGR